MSLKDQLFEAAKPFLMKEGLDSSKEMIASNAASFDEMGMANSNPGEFAPEEITDQENLVNVAKMSNDNNFNQDDSATEVSVSVIGTEMPDSMEALADLVNLGGEECPEEHHHEHHEHAHHIGDIIESILRKKDNTLSESLDEADLNEEELEEIVNYWPGFTNDKPDTGKYVTHLASKLRPSISDIEAGKMDIPADIRNNFKDKDLVGAWRKYNDSNRGDPEYRKAVILSAKELSNGNEEAAMELIKNPTEEMCAKVQTRLMQKLGNTPADINLVPGEDLLDKASSNYKARRAFTNAYLNSFDGKWQSDVLNRFSNYLNPKEIANPLGLADEDIALLKQYNIQPDDPKAQAFLDVLKTNTEVPAAKPAVKRGRGKLAKALESVLAESDYAGNLSYNPDKRLNASDVLNAAKNAVKPELAAALSVVKNVDANQEPSYAIQNIDEKDLPATLEIDTNTDEKVVLKKDGNSYKIDK